VLLSGWGEAQDKAGGDKIKVLIVDGQNNHSVWPKTSEMMRKYLIDSGMFTVDLARTAPQGTDPNFKPDFSKYQLVVSNYNGDAWPEETQKAFEKFISNGGGLVVVHAADNAFPEWDAWNKMIAYIYFDEGSKLVRDTADGNGGSHGAQHDFIVETRDSDHPIMKDVPAKWLHVQDELYDRLRGPAENMKVLASSFAAKDKGGSGRHEPMLMVVNYDKGRIFHTTLGHGDYSQECVGFIALFLRGAEWAATGEVTQKLPNDFPTAESTSRRKFEAGN